MDELPKERHERPMLSLGKTKSREELRDWLGDQKGLLSWKLDGLTVVLTYRDGALFKAVTRGNGEIGEVITPNAKVFVNIPLKIPFQGELVLRGEAVITYEDFERINEKIEDADARYKNPRNLCSGSVRQLSSEITAQRNVRFYAFALVSAQEAAGTGEAAGAGEAEAAVDFENSRKKQFAFLASQGFDVVEYREVDAGNVEEAVSDFEERIRTFPIPSDGLVLIYDDIAYGLSLGTTAKFPRDSIAFKWEDETAETTLLEMEWSASRTGLINPVAIFEPVQLEGTTVSRASVHNVSIVKSLELGIGDRITVYKANMIIPPDRGKSDEKRHPSHSGYLSGLRGKAEIRQVNDVQSLYCTNPDCDAKKVKAFTLFVSRDALNIDGLSEATLEKFLGRGFLHRFADLFHLDRYREEIVAMEGFGEKSYQNLADSIERARTTTLPRVIYGPRHSEHRSCQREDDLPGIQRRPGADDERGRGGAEPDRRRGRRDRRNLLRLLAVTEEPGGYEAAAFGTYHRAYAGGRIRPDAEGTGFRGDRKPEPFRRTQRPEGDHRAKGREGDGKRHGKDHLPHQQRQRLQFRQEQKGEGIKGSRPDGRGIHEALSGDGRIEKRKNRLGADRSPISGFGKVD